MRVLTCACMRVGVRVCVCVSLCRVHGAALRFVALLPGSKLSGTIFVLRVKTGDSRVPRVPRVPRSTPEYPGVPRILRSIRLMRAEYPSSAPGSAVVVQETANRGALALHSSLEYPIEYPFEYPWGDPRVAQKNSTPREPHAVLLQYPQGTPRVPREYRRSTAALQARRSRTSRSSSRRPRCAATH